MFFDRWSIHKSIRVRRKAFWAIKLLACPRGLSLSRIYPILWQRLHFSIGCYNRRRTFWRRQSFEFNIIQVVFADHVHRRSRVYNKLSFLSFNGWWRGQTPIFRRWEECCFYFSPLILGSFWPASTLLRGHIALAIPSLLETDPGKSFQTMDSGLEC